MMSFVAAAARIVVGRVASGSFEYFLLEQEVAYLLAASAQRSLHIALTFTWILASELDTHYSLGALVALQLCDQSPFMQIANWN